MPVFDPGFVTGWFCAPTVVVIMRRFFTFAVLMLCAAAIAAAVSPSTASAWWNTVTHTPGSSAPVHIAVSTLDDGTSAAWAGCTMSVVTDASVDGPLLAAVRTGAAAAAKASGITIEVSADSSVDASTAQTSDLVVVSVGAPDVSGGDVLASTSPYTSDGAITSASIVVSPDRAGQAASEPAGLALTVTHELGHVLGLGHADSTASAMSPTVGSVSGLTGADRAAFAAAGARACR